MSTETPSSHSFPEFRNHFAELGDDFFAHVKPQALSKSRMALVNHTLAQDLGFTPEICASERFLEVFSGQAIGPGSRPLAAVYSGHQFGVWAGQLGDGRAILLGDLAHSNPNYPRQELQLKGAGMTPFSRMGDGRAVLRSSIREYLCSEAMCGLGIPTTRALCLASSPQYAMREQPETTAIVTRVAPSFVRFGSFEHWYYNGEHEKLQSLADYCIQHFFPDLLSIANPYYEFLKRVVQQTAELIAHWQAVGFMHGVMNTDNMSILGLTLDYGPFGFMDGFETQKICNHSDTQGRYAFHMQPRIGQWNCHALAQALLPLIDDIDAAQDALSHYVPSFDTHHEKFLRAKFGLKRRQSEDAQLFETWFELLAGSASDYTYCFRALSDLELNQPDFHNSQTYQKLRNQILDRDGFDTWLRHYQNRLSLENSIETERLTSMKQHNPKYVLRNYLAQEAIEAAEKGDFSVAEQLHEVLKNPFDEQTNFERYAALPPDWASHISVSCSS
ncbi:YdiU family protein [Undibacterium cyanobacteriorum]|uniref:Protein nucleotidyltransferase YdiU n=1 Tax=Undibacterium cyanobacteriorum TaxID=3073561 RepID=A0ABY9RCS9_9BURK|nr:YdiU family protein [Undibacterium sp. 20NA77.5]WMW78974.1 YdiU family protein [Undibacterium sp. 20NA77.5]